MLNKKLKIWREVKDFMNKNDYNNENIHRVSAMINQISDMHFSHRRRVLRSKRK